MTRYRANFLEIITTTGSRPDPAGITWQAEAVSLTTRLAAAANRIEANLLADTCTIERLTESGTFDPITLAEDPPTTSTIYSGQCQFNSPSMARSEELARIGIRLAVSTMRITLPIGATGIQTGDRVTVTGASLFPELVGLVGPLVIGSRTSMSTVREVFADLEEREP